MQESNTQMHDKAKAVIEKAQAQGSRPGLERMLELMNRLGQPQNHVPIIHIAGTNGKGSTCAFIEGILLAAGLKTGMFTSPWIMAPEEMIRLQGQPISPDLFERLLLQVSEAAQGMETLPCGAPTEFELYTAMAYCFFASEHCDIAVVETGLGGRLDATNVEVENVLSVITRISPEHQEWLGNTLEEITAHKAGIMRAGRPVVSAPQHPVVRQGLKAHAERCHSDYSEVDAAKIAVESIRIGEMVFQAENITDLQTRLIGLHQAENAALAIRAVKTLCTFGWPIRETHIRDGIAHTCWPFRFEQILCDPLFILDAAHNPDGVSTFIDTFGRVCPGKKLRLVFGVMRDKDVSAMLYMLKPFLAELILVEPDHPRAMPLAELLEEAKQTCESICTSGTIEQAVTRSLAPSSSDVVRAAIGSMYYLGKMKKLLE